MTDTTRPAVTRPGILWAIGHTVGYTAWLLMQVFIGALTIARQVAKKHSLMSPVVVEYPLRVTKDWQVFLLSTCVTMTPGTLSCGLRVAHNDQPAILLVQAVYGADPQEVLVGIGDMEQRMVPSVTGITHNGGRGGEHARSASSTADRTDTSDGPEGQS